MEKEILEQFKADYENFFMERFVYGSVEPEDYKGPKDKMKLLINLLAAYKYLITKIDMLNLGNIIKIGNLINCNHGIAPGFRKIGVTAGNKADFEPSEPNRIPTDLNELLYSYYYIWDELDVYLKEAMFHIKYMHIHPFEDGNKRSGKLILTTNLCKQGYPPVIITPEYIDEYYVFINNYDYEGFAGFLKQKSIIEDEIMYDFYEKNYKVPGCNIDSKELQKVLIPRKKQS